MIDILVSPQHEFVILILFYVTYMPEDDQTLVETAV